MKTIDFLVQELPKCGGWPDGAIGAGFLCGKGTLYFWDESNDCPTEWKVDTEAEVEDSASEISREQYEAALAAKNDGWIEWGGGRFPPVSTNTFVDVKLENGDVQSGLQAGEYLWEHNWQGSNIIAYRLHQPKEVAQTEAEQEANMNDCIGQTPAAVWNGDGLPPVGCECEMQNDRGEWIAVDIIAQNDGFSFGWNYDYRMVYFSDKPAEFRPIRSEAERKREEAVKTIMLTGWCQSAAEEIYDLVAAGKVPGMKLED